VGEKGLSLAKTPSHGKEQERGELLVIAAIQAITARPSSGKTVADW